MKNYMEYKELEASMKNLKVENKMLADRYVAVNKELQQYRALYENLTASIATLTRSNEKLTEVNLKLAQDNEYERTTKFKPEVSG